MAWRWLDGYRAAALTNGSTPYPLLDVIRILADAAAHVATAHDCDHHGWEVVREAESAARDIIRELTATGSVNDGEGRGSGAAPTRETGDGGKAWVDAWIGADREQVRLFGAKEGE